MTNENKIQYIQINKNTYCVVKYMFRTWPTNLMGANIYVMYGKGKTNSFEIKPKQK